MIFTYMWAFDCKKDWEYIGALEALFKKRNAEVYYVELEANYDQRLIRNKTENRLLLYKPSKRNLEKSENLFLRLEEKYRLNTLEGEFLRTNYIRINNTDISPAKVASTIKEKLNYNIGGRNYAIYRSKS